MVMVKPNNYVRDMTTQAKLCGAATMWVVLANTWHITCFGFLRDLFCFYFILGIVPCLDRWIWIWESMLLLGLQEIFAEIQGWLNDLWYLEILHNWSTTNQWKATFSFTFFTFQVPQNWPLFYFYFSNFLGVTFYFYLSNFFASYLYFYLSIENCYLLQHC